MSFLDLLSLILENLNQRKARVALTAIGVIIGTAAVIILVSLAIGLQESATQSLYGISDLARIDVYPGYGQNGAGAVAVKVAGGGGGGSGPGSEGQVKLLTTQALTDIASIPGVDIVIPRDYIMGEAYFEYNRAQAYANIIGSGEHDMSKMGLAARQGQLQLERGSAIIGVSVAQNFYNPNLRPGQTPPPPPDLFDQTVKLVLVKYTQDGQQIKKTIPIRVIGVVAETRGESDFSFYMTIEDITAYNEWFSGKRINRAKDGYASLIVRVQDPKKVLEVNDQIVALGYQASTPQSFVQGINSFFIILQVIFGGVGAISLLVAAIGIANTMTMSILERTREIGLMKAIGATNRDVLSVFLGEAAGIGFLGGIGGIILGWGAAQVLNLLAISYLASQAAQQGGAPPSTAASTPAWLPIFALVFATLIGLLSGLYPALRAATLVPINALKYE